MTTVANDRIHVMIVGRKDPIKSAVYALTHLLREAPTPVEGRRERKPLAELEHQLVRDVATKAGHEASRVRGCGTGHGIQPGFGRPLVRMGMSTGEAARVADLLVSSLLRDQHPQVLDQLWLRTVLIEQWRRTRLNERPAFERRADRMLAALDLPVSTDPLTRLPDQTHPEA